MAGRPLPPSADWAAVTRDCVVFVHAHPDDEAIFTGGTMVRLAEAGTRVVLVVATGGELGEAPAGLAGGGPEANGTGTGPATTAERLPELAKRRREETDAAAGALGIARVAWLGYRDSGMA